MIYDWDKFGRPRPALFDRVMAVFSAVIATALWPVFLLLALHDWTLILVPLLYTCVVAFQWVALRKVYAADRPRPDYAAIARMEREVYGEAFKHEGAPGMPRSLPLLCVHGHGGQVRTQRPSQMCPECERRREVAKDRSRMGIACECGSDGHNLPCYCDEARRERLANLRWERRS